VVFHPCGYISETVRNPRRDRGVLRRERQKQSPVDTGAPPLDGRPAPLQPLNEKQLTSRPNNCIRVSRVDAASTHMVNILDTRDRQNWRALNWYAIPPNANLRYFRCLWWIGMWKYASFKSIEIGRATCRES